jgi:hypothetical protein
MYLFFDKILEMAPALETLSSNPNTMSASLFTGILDTKTQIPYNTRANKTKQCL